MKKTLLAVLTLAIVLCFCGCRQRELLNSVNGKQSIEILVVLNKVGIIADRERINSNKGEIYKIFVNDQDYQKSLETLYQYGLPRREQEELENITRPQGFLPETPEMATLRKEIALSLQVEKLLLALSNVIDAKVVIRGDSNRLNGAKMETASPRATVIIRYLGENDTPQFTVDEIKKLVAQAVTGLDQNNIAVSFTKISSLASLEQGNVNNSFTILSPFRFRVLNSDLELAKKQLWGATIIIVLLVGVVGLVVAKMSQKLTARMEMITLETIDNKNLVIEANTAKLKTRKPTLMIKAKEISDETPH